MAVINFLDYQLTGLKYEKNYDFLEREDGNVGYEPVFNYSVSNTDYEKKLYEVKVSVGINATEFPFVVSVDLVAQFNFDSENPDDNFEDFLPNALAIVFPYLRSAVSQLSLMSNEYSALQFPTVNLYQLIQQNKNN
ncbi:protein-export chaperone SecB [Weissella confusa]|uniref:protein-export chaperone SecB n=1 Tax=Weissella confusa TaxID=1583 RepID=UPI0022FEA0CB|nr:protein-export chaperone SecB [Weissella confusa]